MLLTSKALWVANGQKKKILGKWMVDIEFTNQKKNNLELFVMDGRFPTLMGCSWIHAFLGKNWLDIAPQADRSKDIGQFKTPVMNSEDGASFMNYVRDKESECKIKDYVQQLKQKSIFQPGLGLVQNYEPKLTLKEIAKPVFMKTISLSYVL